ncbi:ROM1 isoform 2 [Pongo abelii]|uniref:ROM1 isoform 2 n=2 Tax=Pongo abelii TaxID=9601 RepID=A0A2J8TXT4_PONAB|nr:ROM1 isoform 2 [Pongo abelii]
MGSLSPVATPTHPGLACKTVFQTPTPTPCSIPDNPTKTSGPKGAMRCCWSTCRTWQAHWVACWLSPSYYRLWCSSACGTCKQHWRGLEGSLMGKERPRAISFPVG